jgi:serine/threonine-protein kinase
MGLTRNEIAIRTGRSERAIENIESGRPASTNAIRHVCEVLGLPTDTYEKFINFESPTDSASSTAALPSDTRRKVVFPLHGIRTYADWQLAFVTVAQQHNLYAPLEKWNFGYFSIFRFLLPRQREAKIRWFRSNYDDLIDNTYAGLGPDNCPSVIAHSFGTYILGYALLKYRNIRLDKVILCGSILPRNFPWQELIERGQVRELRNEYGVKDSWVRFAKWFVKGSGSSGQNGFTQNGFKLQSDRITQEEFVFEHSEYFNRGHMTEFWVPFLLRPSDPVPAVATDRPVRLPSSPPPYALYAIYILIVLGLALGLARAF